MNHLQSMQGVEGEMRSERFRRKWATLCDEGRQKSDHVDRWKPSVTEVKHVSKPGAFAVCRQAEVQFFNELEIGTGGGRSVQPFSSVSFT